MPRAWAGRTAVEFGPLEDDARTRARDNKCSTCIYKIHARCLYEIPGEPSSPLLLRFFRQWRYVEGGAIRVCE